ncbi:protein FMC1 homolog isoform X2 [Neodiprion pinetum]|uniref:Protein FMC1 homolog n=1 Tax=Neodiprion lecontei TaxID=441921 RepID=A0A6J0CAS0_NEOLC|nr:protein FMC1 homolog isoform X3 [Neodiprion lecontei]XP_046418561.1 protein FMC1 homolog isoform X3 [Neodiprion fabricii]XP_046418562.1 protein FMC1 homolog isoform X3 [Neodiprion fabricii]XP_046418563.1 protein FMC1 homolog isoform X3 [Neodiprion fabricii]XP_046474269.1 protein FMC1 homolog isoform X3 [Neodiprion pinetum]XP_046474270.1 protein FMC1 homolog isoform X3 [Neodiprion pinetum]XP_046474271.1 protein FMC1 homolog isoform X3 [Neodiprion pinetum]XP_046591723.1 protein FMC1 homolog
MNGNLKILRSLINEIRHVAKEKKMKDNIMVQYILEEAKKHRETSEVLCKAREELKSMGENYLCYLESQRKYNEIRTQYAGKGDRSVKETADLVGFKLPHDPK